ncbi:MAG: hypothetical protein ABR584_07145 [Candidatus Baltobacteraceae bacterium]
MMQAAKKALFAGSCALTISALAACGHQNSSTTTTTTETHREAAASPDAPGMQAGGTGGIRSACEVLTATAVQEIVGTSVTAKESSMASDGVPNSTCTYSAEAVVTIEIPKAGTTEATMQTLREAAAASGGNQVVGQKGDMIVSVYSNSGKSKMIYEAAAAKLWTVVFLDEFWTTFRYD